MGNDNAARAKMIREAGRGESAFALATMALDHGGSGAEAAAGLLLAMQYGGTFNFEGLLSLDSINRAHADMILLGYRPHEIWPSRWMTEAGYDGLQIMSALRDKWQREEAE